METARDRGNSGGSAILQSIPLSAQLIAAMCVSIGAVMAGYLAYDAYETRRRLMAVEHATMTALSPVLTDIVEMSMLHEKRGHIDELLDSLQHSAVFGRVELLDGGKAVVGARRLASKAGSAGAAGPARATNLVMDFPLDSKPACVRCHGAGSRRLGYIRLVSHLEGMEETVSRLNRMRIAMVSCVAAILGFSSLLIVRALVHAPMRGFVAAMEALGSGDLQARIREPLPGELRSIADGFNVMAERLARSRTEIKELHQREVAHLDRLASVGELAASLAHEVRNPLTGIGSAVQVLRQELPKEDARREVLSRMLGQLERMNRTITSFLEYARMPAMALSYFPIREPLLRASALMEARLRGQRIELVKDIPEGLPPIRGDASQLEQVFLNLLLNAAQAMPDGGTLRVAARAGNGGGVAVEVSDTGAGIEPGHRDRIFQPFFTTKRGGSGLGLPVCRRIVLAHGGEIGVESAPGGGTVARVRLPAAPARGA